MLYRKHGGGDFSSTFELMNTVMIWNVNKPRPMKHVHGWIWYVHLLQNSFTYSLFIQTTKANKERGNMQPNNE